MDFYCSIVKVKDETTGNCTKTTTSRWPSNSFFFHSTRTENGDLDATTINFENINNFIHLQLITDFSTALHHDRET